MSQMIEYVRKRGPVVAIFTDEETGERVLVRGKGTPYGCLYAKKIVDKDGMYRIALGWSLCNRKDNFSKDEAVIIASERASERFGSKMRVPASFEDKFLAFAERAKKFYRLNNFAHTYVIVKEEVLDV